MFDYVVTAEWIETAVATCSDARSTQNMLEIVFLRQHFSRCTIAVLSVKVLHVFSNSSLGISNFMLAQIALWK